VRRKIKLHLDSRSDFYIQFRISNSWDGMNLTVRVAE